MSPSKKKPKATTVPAAKDSTEPQEQALFARVVDLIHASRQHVARSVNTTMVQAYWLIGPDIVEVEQHGTARARYGDELIAGLAKHLRSEVGKGFGARTLRRIRLFYLIYPEGSALPPELGGAEIRSAPLTKSRGALAVGFPPTLSWTHYLILLKVTNPAARSFYEIEAAREDWSSRELERQVASLLFERLAKSRDKEKVLDLARRGHVNYYDRYQRAEHEAKTIGIVLCSEKNDAMAKITLPEDNEQILAARYQMYLPTEEELREELEREREAAERTLRLAASESDDGG
jgi:hypothetical protein